MTVEQAICERLLADASVIAIVGTRGYLLKLPESPTLPALRVTLISAQEMSHTRGNRRTRPNRVQVDAVAGESQSTDPYDAATTLAQAIAAALMGKAPFVADDLEVRVVEREAQPVIYDPDELRQVLVPQDFTVWTTAAA